MLHPDQPLSLRYVQQPMGRRDYRTWRRRDAPPPLRRSSGAAAAGLLARLVAVVMRLLEERFVIDRRETLSSGTRTLFAATPRA